MINKEMLGKFAEYLVLTELLKRNIEAYPAISFQQEDYDITVVLNGKTVVRIEVKSTDLQDGGGTNNPISNLNKEFNFLVLVVVDGNNQRYFILNKDEAENEREKTTKAKQIYTSIKERKCPYVVRDNILKYENKWEKITNFTG